MTRPPSTTFRVVVMLATIGVATVACGSRTLPQSTRSDVPLAPTTTRIVLSSGEAMDTSSGEAMDTSSGEAGSDPGDASAATNGDPNTDGIESATTVAGTGAVSDATDRPQVEDGWTDATANLVDLQSECGTVHYMTANPATGEVIAGVAAEGLWKLDATSGMWNRLGTGEGSAAITNRPTSITFDPLDPNRFWESGIDGGGVYRTDDGGDTFRRVGDIEDIDYLSVDQSDPFRQTMLAGGHEARALYRSINGGVEWFDITAALPDGNIGFTSYPVVIDSSTHLLGTHGSDGSGVFRSVDGGFSWDRVHEGGVIGNPLIVDGTIHWASESGGIVVSTDAGSTFESGGAPTGGPPMSLVSVGDGRIVTWGDSTLVVTDDGGQTWFAFGPQLDAPLDGVTYSADPASFYAWERSCPEAGEVVVEAGSIRHFEVVPDGSDVVPDEG